MCARSGVNQREPDPVVDYVRWVMVRKHDPDAPAPETVVPELPEAVDAGELVNPFQLNASSLRHGCCSGSPYLWEDYAVGERIDHVDGVTIEEAEHMLATRLYQNTARVHFNQHVRKRRSVWAPHRLRWAYYEHRPFTLLQRSRQRP